MSTKQNYKINTNYRMEIIKIVSLCYITKTYQVAGSIQHNTDTCVREQICQYWSECFLWVYCNDIYKLIMKAILLCLRTIKRLVLDKQGATYHSLNQSYQTTFIELLVQVLSFMVISKDLFDPQYCNIQVWGRTSFARNLFAFALNALE